MRIVRAIACALILAGCGGQAGNQDHVSIEEMTADPVAGQAVEKQQCDLATALDYFDPEGVEVGVVEACHVMTGDGPNYTVYGYDSDLAATAAMGAWESGLIGSAPFTQMENVESLDDTALGEGSLHLRSTSPEIHRVIAQSGPYVIQVSGESLDDVRDAAIELNSRIPDGSVPAANE